MNNTILKRVLGVSFWSLINALALRLLNLLSLYLAARYLSTTDYGSLALMQNTAQTWSIFLAGGLSLTMAKYVGEFRMATPDRAASIISSLSILTLTMGLMLLLIAILFSHTIALQFFHKNLSPTDITILALWILIMSFQAIMQGAITGLEQYKKNALLAIIGGCVALTFILCTPHQRGWIIAALITGALFTCINITKLVFSTVKSWGSFKWRYFDLAYFELILKFGLPAFLSSLVLTQAQWYANLKVANNSGLAELAGLNVSLQWYSVILFIPGAVSNSMLPMLSRMVSDRVQQLKFLFAAFSINLLISSALVVVAVCWRHQILAHYGPEYIFYAQVFKYLAIASAINGASSIFMQQIASFGKGLILLYMNLLWAALFLGTIFLTASTENVGIHVANGYLIANSAQAGLAMLIALYLSKQTTH